MNKGRSCIVCNTSISGRSDKKFCNDICRNTYHNELKGRRNPEIVKFDRIKKLLDSMDKDAQRLIVWSHLRYLLALDKKGIDWILEKVGELIEAEQASLLSGLQ